MPTTASIHKICHALNTTRRHLELLLPRLETYSNAIDEDPSTKTKPHLLAARDNADSAHEMICDIVVSLQALLLHENPDVDDFTGSLLEQVLESLLTSPTRSR